MTEPTFTPTCRYGHGELVKVDGRHRPQRWALVAHDDPNVIFAGSLHVCPQCGYLEMFDDDIASTLAERKQA